MSLAPPGVAAWAWLGLPFALACAGTWAARRYALGRRLIDEPGGRRSHAVPTPRGGGVAIVLAWLAALGWLVAIGSWPPAMGLATGSGLVLVASAGWIDDHRPLSPWVRLLCHALAAAGLAWGIAASGGDAVSVVTAFVLALGLVNAWNFMDGIDGIAASQAALAAAGYAWLATDGGTGALAAALAAACAGFLPFNLPWPRARIFLGDVGSGALGFAIAAVVAASLRDAATPARLVLFLPLTAFLVDTTLTLGMRMIRGERWWLPHAQHAYQRWSRAAGRHGRPTLAYGAWTAMAVVAMVLSARQSALIAVTMVVSLSLVAVWLWLRLQAMERLDVMEHGR